MQIDLSGEATLSAPELRTDGSTSSSEPGYYVAPSPSKARKPESSSALPQRKADPFTGAPASARQSPVDGLTAGGEVNQNYRSPFSAEDEGSEASESEASGTEEATGPKLRAASVAKRSTPQDVRMDTTARSEDAEESRHAVSGRDTSSTPRAPQFTLEVASSARAGTHHRIPSTPAHWQRSQRADESADGFDFQKIGPASGEEERWEDNNEAGPAAPSMSQSSVESASQGQSYGHLLEMAARVPSASAFAPASAAQADVARLPAESALRDNRSLEQYALLPQQPVAGQVDIISDSDVGASDVSDSDDTEPAHEVTSRHARDSQSPGKKHRGRRPKKDDPQKRKASALHGSQSSGSSQTLETPRESKKARVEPGTIQHHFALLTSAQQPKHTHKSTTSSSKTVRSRAEAPVATVISDDDTGHAPIPPSSNRHKPEEFADPPSARTRSAPSSSTLRNFSPARSSSQPSTSHPTPRSYPHQPPSRQAQSYEDSAASTSPERRRTGTHTRFSQDDIITL